MRVVSLLAGGTEIVCALGAGEMLVGRSHECDNPTRVRGLPACTRPAFDVNRSSREIDAEVRRRIQAKEPLYHVDADLINQLKPDLLITQTHCDVCAVTPDDVERAGCAVVNQIVSLSAGSVAGIFESVRRIAQALERPLAGDDLIAHMQARIEAVNTKVRARPTPSIVLLEWTDPIFTTGNWGPQLVEAAGGQLLLGEKGHSTAIPWERVVAAEPEYIVVAPCGFDLERTMRDVPVLEALPHWFDLRAVKNGHVALADGNTYFNRSGTTIVETVEILAEILHGNQVEARWRGEVWHPYVPEPRRHLTHRTASAQHT